MIRFVSSFGILLIIVLVLLLRSEYMFDHFEMVSGLGQRFRLVNGTHYKTEYTICTPGMKEIMLKNPLPIKLNKTVDIHRYEMSGCFEINTNESGINKIINERNCLSTKCMPFEKRFLNNTGTEERTALLSIPGSGNHWVRHLLEEITAFKAFLNNQIDQCHVAKWINSFKGDLFILYYDKLKTDLANSLTKVAAFLHSEVSLERLLCTANNKDGSYKRVGKPEFMSRKNFVDVNMEKRILKWKEAIHNALMRRKSPWASN